MNYNNDDNFSYLDYTDTDNLSKYCVLCGIKLQEESEFFECSECIEFYEKDKITFTKALEKE